MKWIIMGVLFCVCVGVGYLFSMKFKKRVQFYSALIMLAQKLDVEINFSRERLKKLIESVDDKTRKNLFEVDNNFISYLDSEGELDMNKLLAKCTFLKNDEKEMVYLFFKNLGRSDVTGQTKEIQNFLKRFDDNLAKCTTENKKYGSLCVKLGIIAGLFMVVILI